MTTKKVASQKLLTNRIQDAQFFDIGVQEQFVEITFCAHIMHGLSELAKGTKMSLKEWVSYLYIESVHI